MQRGLTYKMAVTAGIIALFLLTNTTSASEHLLQAMGMSKLPAKAAPDFNLPDIDGKQISLQDYRGRLIFLNFWATWCIPCREEMPAMQALQQMFQPQGLEVLAVNYQEKPDKVKAFIDQHRLSFAALLDHDGSVFRAYSVMGLPTTYLISRDGTLLARAVGGRDWTLSEGKDLIRELLGGASAGPKRSMTMTEGN